MTAILSIAIVSILMIVLGIIVILEGDDKQLGKDIIKGTLTFDAMYILLVFTIALL